MPTQPEHLLRQYQIKQTPAEVLKESPHNVRKDSAKAFSKMKASLKRTRLMMPLVINKDNIVFIGNLRLRAGLAIGAQFFPTILDETLSDAELRTLAILNNRSAAETEDDADKLFAELKALEALCIPLEFTGFDTSELDFILDAPPLSPRLLKEDDIGLADGPKGANAHVSAV